MAKSRDWTQRIKKDWKQRPEFLKFLEMVVAHNGGIFKTAPFASACRISRPTVMSYLAELETSGLVQVIRPFPLRSSDEMLSAPKLYACDPDFVCSVRGWREIRPERRGPLWELSVLNEIRRLTPHIEIRYWRDKRGHEIDFVLVPRGKPPVAIECKWSSNNIEVGNLRAFRSRYPNGENWLVLADVDRTFKKVQKGLEWDCMGLKEMVRRLARLSRL